MIPASFQQLLNITLRFVDTDRDSVLAYATEPRIAAVLLFSQEQTVRGEADMARMTHALIERVLAIGGTYYLPYRPHASLDQLTRGYPRAAAFAARKRERRSRSAVPQSTLGRVSLASVTREDTVGKLRTIALVYMVVLLAAASLNYIPGLTDAEGRAFGVFALDIFDDGLHVASALWAGIAARSRRAAPRASSCCYFGLLYLTDGLLGLAAGSGYLDLGIINHGVAGPAADVQDPGEPAAHRRRRLRRVREHSATSTRRADAQAARIAAQRSGGSQVAAGASARRRRPAAADAGRLRRTGLPRRRARADLPAADHRSRLPAP